MRRNGWVYLGVDLHDVGGEALGQVVVEVSIVLVDVGWFGCAC